MTVRWRFACRRRVKEHPDYFCVCSSCSSAGRRGLAALGPAHGAHGRACAPMAAICAGIIGLGAAPPAGGVRGGLGVTGLLQSTTATALMTASFAARGLVATAPALAVMLGADVGTSLVAQALSFDLDWLSPLLRPRRRRAVHGGRAIAAARSRPRRDRARPDAAVRCSLIVGGDRADPRIPPCCETCSARSRASRCWPWWSPPASPGSRIPAWPSCCWSCRSPRWRAAGAARAGAVVLGANLGGALPAGARDMARR